MGPFASQSLGDMGADVVKIEAPLGDLVRQIGPARHPEMGPIFLNTNRNKRSVAVDLKKPAGLAVVRRLLADADVLIYNVRRTRWPGSASTTKPSRRSIRASSTPACSASARTARMRRDRPTTT